MEFPDSLRKISASLAATRGFAAALADALSGSSAGSQCHAGLLAWSSSGDGYGAVERLSPTQDLREAAANLYGAMRRLDEADLELIVAEPVPETGLGVAIMERLRKAAARD